MVTNDPRSTSESLAWLLELRLKVRGNREATAIVDRCLALCARGAAADPETCRHLSAEVAELADTLALRFGAPRNVVRN